jgi:hypothetical protein
MHNETKEICEAHLHSLGSDDCHRKLGNERSVVDRQSGGKRERKEENAVEISLNFNEIELNFQGKDNFSAFKVVWMGKAIRISNKTHREKKNN